MSCQSLLGNRLGAPGCPQMSRCQQRGHVLAVNLAEKRGREKEQHPRLCPWVLARASCALRADFGCGRSWELRSLRISLRASINKERLEVKTDFFQLGLDGSAPTEPPCLRN